MRQKRVNIAIKGRSIEARDTDGCKRRCNVEAWEPDPLLNITPAAVKVQ